MPSKKRKVNCNMKRKLLNSFAVLSLALLLFGVNNGVVFASSGCIAYDTTGQHSMTKRVDIEEYARQIPSDRPNYLKFEIYNVYRMECSACGFTSKEYRYEEFVNIRWVRIV